MSVVTIPLQTFKQHIEYEFIHGSAIAPNLFQSAVNFIEDTGYWETHQALGFEVRPQWQTRKPHDFGVLAGLQQETGEYWQFKPEKPLTDKKGKTQKYQTAKGNGSRAFLPAVTVWVWVEVAKRYNLQEDLPKWVKNAAIASLWNKKSDSPPLIAKEIPLPEQEPRTKPIGFTNLGTSSKTNYAPQFSKDTNFTQQDSPKWFSKAIWEESSPLPCNPTHPEIQETKLPTTDGMVLDIASELSPVDDGLIPSTTTKYQGHSFWHWLAVHPEIPTIWTEGGKKSLCLLSQGYVAIALYGVHGGYRVKDELGNPISPILTADVARFAQPGRKHILAFDQDAKPSTITKVNRALWRFGCLLEQSGGEVAIASWKPEQGKGVDDLLVQSGVEAWDVAHSEAMPLTHWQIWQRLSDQLTHKASIRLNTAHLTELNPQCLPDTGIIAIASAKGTEKTKLIGRLTAQSKTVLAAGHRICLMRNLCQRWGIHYRGDLDKANGQFITGSGYTLKVGLCVDGLLAIDPEKFRGCDLIIDEVNQVLRHLITSTTCRKDGRLPALLAKLHQLIQVAKRVIVADADLNKGVLDYLRSLRGDNVPIFLVRNDYQPQGYSVEFLQSSNATVITAQLLKDCRQRLPGQVLFVVTDSKMGSKTLARLVSQVEGLGLRVLVINSETSGGKDEQEFINHPDRVLVRGEYDAIICSPSLATGVSIEAQGIISKVYGIFYGASSTDGDMAQSLARVREPVNRVVWCAKYGRNFSKVSRSTNPLELKSQLKQRTDATAMLIRSQLREDVVGAIAGYDWQSDLHLNLWAQTTADQNRAMHSLRDALLVRLRFEGNQVTMIDAGSDQAMKLLTKQAKEEIRQIEADTVSKSRVLTRSEVLRLEARQAHTPNEKLAIARYYMSDFYATDDVSSELVLWDNNGRRRSELLSLEAMLYPDVAIERDVRGLEKQAAWKKGVVPWDVGTAALKRRLRGELNLDDFLDPDKEWTKYDHKPYADKARELKSQIKLGLKFSIPDGMSDTQIIHQLLADMGIKFEFRWSRFVEGHEGEKLRVHRLDSANWQQLIDVLDRRAVKREKPQMTEQDCGSCLFESSYTAGDDPMVKIPLEHANWFTLESLNDVRLMWIQADSEEVRAEIRRFVPPAVLERAIS